MKNLKEFRSARQSGLANLDNFFDLLQFYSELYIRDKLTNSLDAGLRSELVSWSKELKVSLKKLNSTIDAILDQLFTGVLKYKYVEYKND